MPESWETRLHRWYFNFFPAYCGTGAKVTYIARDWKEIQIRLPLSWRTRNYVGTIYGGSMYGAVDPMYMIMLIKLLGPDYIVWDKAARIQFKKPGRTTLYAAFKIDGGEIERIQMSLEAQPRLDCTYRVELVDRQGDVFAEVEKVIHVRRRSG